jgi:hypothetical protein
MRMPLSKRAHVRLSTLTSRALDRKCLVCRRVGTRVVSRPSTTQRSGLKAGVDRTLCIIMCILSAVHESDCETAASGETCRFQSVSMELEMRDTQTDVAIRSGAVRLDLTQSQVKVDICINNKVFLNQNVRPVIQPHEASLPLLPCSVR